MSHQLRRTSTRDTTPHSSSCTATYHKTTKTIKISRTRHAGHCRRRRDELISDLLLWTSSHGWAKAASPARTYIEQLCVDTACSLEVLPEAMDNREVWRERVINICPDSATWWWWRWSLYLTFLYFILSLINIYRREEKDTHTHTHTHTYIYIYIYIYMYIYYER